MTDYSHGSKELHESAAAKSYPTEPCGVPVNASGAFTHSERVNTTREGELNEENIQTKSR